jgi:hypothetical protein
MANWRKTREYRVWRAQVIRRDKCCVICGNIKGRAAHHMHDGSSHPEVRFDPDNGVCLCAECHMQFHCNYKKSYRQKCTMDDFINFKELMGYAIGRGAVICVDGIEAKIAAALGCMQPPDPGAAQILEDNLDKLV